MISKPFPEINREGAEAAGYLRLVAIAVRRYSREPAERINAARLMASGAIALLAHETSPGAAALDVAEFVAALSAAQRMADRMEAKQSGEAR